MKATEFAIAMNNVLRQGFSPICVISIAEWMNLQQLVKESTHYGETVNFLQIHSNRCFHL